ncbi:glycerophosphodiester phosphodiesterase [Acidipropionibacterium acidipropionici]|uniref:Glycerophosphodiester phosphodiesterase n=1 Tax=Acidipropionibacterium acidipropionici TaxID=1748 RepID=A0AAC9AND0_9ACTN|nr:glycerophosphodiester phosphodiesterase family protein [Acidipropionibacterium acidipropionici]AMS05470.1 glycerophosphodiester phosphodiesterase [Acidipropionibacterium acidipropionici]AOZ46942.1 glycerophosphodiester phosphodiesterase [Acidipropionibacterium acidipropionici]AZP36967.1 glycerophosphodiester phosphodiesterase [Acidipropionibacterium acidipropionici]
MPAIFAHRGANKSSCANKNLPENTMAAFAAAIEVGADGIELDVQLTRDGRIVVCHDETVDRVSDGHGLVIDHTFEELARLNFAATFSDQEPARIPLLDDVLALLAPTELSLNIELKNSVIRYDQLEERVVDAVNAHQMADRTVLSSFNHRSLVHLAQIAPGIRRGVLYSNDLADPWDYASRIGVQAVHPSGLLLRGRDDVGRFHAAGLSVRVWTLDEPDQIREAAALGVDAVITNDPAGARAALS